MLPSAVDHNHRGNQVVSGLFDGGNIEADQRLSRFHPIPHLQRRAKVLAVKIDGVDTDMDQQLNTAVALQANGVAGGQKHHYRAAKRRAQYSLFGTNRQPLAQQTAGKDVVVHFTERQHLTAQRA